MIKRSNKRREMDVDFEEKRFNLSLGQAELDRENDYYTRPASPVLKSIPEPGYDPYDERQAIRHFRTGVCSDDCDERWGSDTSVEMYFYEPQEGH